MKRELKVNVFVVAVILLLFYFEIGAVRSVIFPSTIIQIGAMLISVLIFIFNSKELKITLYEFMWFAAITLFVLFRNQYLVIGESDNNILYYYMMCIIMVFAKKPTSWIHYFVDFIFWISLVHALVTIIFALNHSLYVTYITTFLKGDIASGNLRHLNSGAIAGLFSNYGANAGILAIGTGVAFVRLMVKKRVDLVKNIIHILIRLTALLFTGKRSPVIMMLIALSLVYLFIEKRGSEKKIIRIVLIVGSLLGMFLFFTPLVPQLEVLSRRIMNTEDWDTLGGRTELYDLAFSMIKQNPIFGSGWHSYQLMAAKTIGLKYPPAFARMQAHNIYLQMMSETGIVGTLSMVLLFLIPIKKVFSMFRTHKFKKINLFIGEENLICSISCLFILIFFLLYGLTGNPMYDAYIYFLAFLSCGAIQSIDGVVTEKIKNTN